MEDSVIVEKVLGAYFIAVSCIENFFFWPAGYFVVRSYWNEVESMWLGILTGCICSMHPLGKLLSAKLISYISSKVSFKCFLMIQFLLSAITALFLGVFPTFLGLFIFRFSSGVGSNTQIIFRRIYFNISLKHKTFWPNVAYSLLWASRIGGFLGIISAGMLSGNTIIDNKPSKNVSQWFLASLLLFLFYFSGLLLVFSIDGNSLVVFGNEKYSEMKENNENQKEIEQNSEEHKSGSRPAGFFNFTKMLERKFQKQNEENDEKLEKSEENYAKNEEFLENTEIDEVKYFSPRHISNKSSCFKPPMSARVELSGRESADTIKADLFSDFKKTHISIIEDDMIDVPKSEAVEKIAEIKENCLILEPSYYLASIYRVLLTGLITLIADSLPYTLIFHYPEATIMQVSGIIATAYLTSTMFVLFFINCIKKKVPCSAINHFCISLLIITLAIQSSLSVFVLPLYIHLGVFTVLLVLCEMIMPVGCIFIADSVNYSERDLAIEKNNYFCLICKILCNLLASALVFGLHPVAAFLTYLMVSVILLIFSKKLTPRYKHFCKAPYHL